MSAPLPRHDLRHRDGRHLYVYGELRGRLDPAEPAAAGVPSQVHQRFDALTASWVAISPARNTRPTDNAARETSQSTRSAPLRSGCPLCPGGPEVPFSYQAAVFDNRFPTYLPDPPPVPDDRWFAPSVGRCEVVLYTEAHVGSLATLPAQDLGRVVAVWRDRSDALWADPRHAFVLTFENRGEAVGATLSHPHGQIYAFPSVPPLIADRVEVLRRYREQTGTCLTCAVVARDDAAPERTVSLNPSFSVAVPFAPRWPFEVHVRARRHGAGRLGRLEAGERGDLAAALAEVVARYDALYGAPLAYMMAVEEAPAGAGDWHLDVAFLPPNRSEGSYKVRASVETATGQFINDTVPESSAERLRDLPVAARPAVEVPEVVPG